MNDGGRLGVNESVGNGTLVGRVGYRTLVG